MLHINGVVVLSALKLWRTRGMQALLSMLGVVAGVSGLVMVIALGDGANRELESALGSLGAGSVIIRSGTQQDDNVLGIDTLEAVHRLLATMLHRYAALKSEQVQAAAEGELLENVKLIGTQREYYALYKLKLHAGRFLTAHDLAARARVCVLGWETGKGLFPRGQVVGQQVRIGGDWCTVVGWLALNTYQMPKLEGLGVSDVDRVIYTPITTLAGRREGFIVDEFILQFKDEAYMSAALGTLKRIVTRQVGEAAVDFIVPIELLRQKQKLQQLFQYFLLGIAAILLLVGGTGIMNIMLLNVISRRPEIGLRRALGATRQDIISQFVTESLVIAVAGGIMGVVLGFLV